MPKKDSSKRRLRSRSTRRKTLRSAPIAQATLLCTPRPSVVSCSARFPSRCAVCGERIDIGERLFYIYRWRLSAHASCVPDKRDLEQIDRVVTAPRRVRAGQLVRNPDDQDCACTGAGWLRVVGVLSRFIDEGGERVGLDRDAGWAYDCYLRPASAAEADLAEELERRAEQSLRVKERVEELSALIRREGTVTAEPPEGDRLIERHDGFGGYSCFVVGNGKVAYVHEVGGAQLAWVVSSDQHDETLEQELYAIERGTVSEE